MLAVFPLLILVYAGATAMERYMPAASVTLALCVAAIGLPLMGRGDQRFDRAQIVVLGAGLLGILMPAAVQWWEHAPLGVWWKSGEHLLALTLAASLMSAPVPLARMFHVFLASASLAMILAFIPIWSGGGLRGDDMLPAQLFWYNFGLGNPNLLINTLGLAACGHLVWVVGSWRQGLQVPRASLILAVLGFTVTMVLAVATARRGIVLAGVFGASILGITALWHHHRRVAVASIAVLGLLFAVGVAYGLATMHSELRSERGLLYLSMLEFGCDRWWVGHGHYACRLSQFATTDACAAYNALGLWGLSAHSEPLDAFVDAGVVGLLVCLGIIALTWHRCWAHAPGRERTTLLFLVAGATVIACLDNAYSRLIGMWWLSCLIGLVFHVEGGGRMTSLPFLRPCAWAVALLAAIGSTTLTSSAFMSSSAYPSVHIRTVRETCEPELLLAHARLATAILIKEGDWAATDLVIDSQSRRIGPTYYSLACQAEARRNTSQPGEAQVGPLRLLTRGAIFDAGSHQLVAGLLVQRPDLAVAFPAVVRERAARWAALPDLPRVKLPFPPPANAQEAATQLAQLGWAVQHQAEDPGIAKSLQQVFSSYPTWRQTVVVMMHYITAGSQPEIMLDAGMVARMVRAFPSGQEGRILASVQTVDQARRIKPILEARYRGVAAGEHVAEIDRILTLAGIPHELR